MSHPMEMAWSERVVYLAQFDNPKTLTLACGHVIPNAAGAQFWDYYGLKWGMITTPVVRADVDTSGLLPHGVTYWFTDVDNSRAVCEDCGKKRAASHR